MDYTRKIIELLILKQQPVSANTIAMYLDVSKRSVINYIGQINSTKKIIFPVNDGYISHQSDLLDYLATNEEQMDSGKRQEAVLIKLLITDESINVYDLAEEFFVSESTLLSIINHLNKKYSSSGVKITRKKEELLLQCTDQKRRTLLKNRLTNYHETNITNIEDIYKYFKPTSFVDSIIQTIQETSEQSGLLVNDYLYVSFVMHCCIAVYSNYDNNKSQRLYLNKYSSSDIHKQFILQLEKNCNIQLNDSNIEYILNQFDFTFFNRSNLTVDTTQRKVIDRAFDHVNEKFGIDLKSKSRANSVDLHILQMVERIESDKAIFCPLTEVIKQDHMILFEVGILIADEIEDGFQLQSKINEHEIALLTLHIDSILTNKINEKLNVALLVPDRFHQTDTLFDFFERYFSNELSVHIFVANHEKFIKDQFDIVFSLVGNQSFWESDFVTLDVFNEKKNIEIISNAIEKYNQQLSLNFIKPRIDQLFEENLFFNNIDKNFSGKYQLLDFLTESLINKQYIDHKIKNSVIERERKASTRFGNIAIPHEFSISAKVSKICVMKSEQGYLWDDGVVNLIFLIIIKKEDRFYFHHFLNAISNLFDDQLSHFITSKKFDFSDFIEYLQP